MIPSAPHDPVAPIDACRDGSHLVRTPLVPVRLEPGGPAIWCKLEYLNPSGSTKDRLARHVLEKAWRRGQLEPGARVIEASSGSTSIALALQCARMGLAFTAVMPEGVSNERVWMIRAYGGSVEFVPKGAGIARAIARADELAADRGAFAPCQFTNPDNAEAHRLHTAQEIVQQIPGGAVEAVVSGVGTGGTLVGLAAGLADAGNNPLAVAARPVHHQASGLGDVECCSFSTRVPGVVDGIRTLFQIMPPARTVEHEVEDDEAIATTRRLIARGFPVGPSSGLNFAAALATAAQLGPNARIVTVFPDRMERYFSTELFQGLRDA
jgi:cysteine synthase A